MTNFEILKNKIFPVLVLTSWLLIGLYFGIGGYLKLDTSEQVVRLSNKYTDIDTTSSEATRLRMSADIFIIATTQEQTEKLFWWSSETPPFLDFLITTCAFGLLGSVANLIWKIAANKYLLYEIKYFSVPVLGLLNGIFILGMIKIIPEILVKDKGDIRPESLFFLSLFGGFFATKFYDYMHAVIGKRIFNNDKK